MSDGKPSVHLPLLTAATRLAGPLFRPQKNPVNICEGIEHRVITYWEFPVG